MTHNHKNYNELYVFNYTFYNELRKYNNIFYSELFFEVNSRLP